MRGMDLPDLADVPNSLAEIVTLLAERLNGQMMPFPRLSTLLIAYMACPRIKEIGTGGWSLTLHDS
jgi:hypothetical protein